MAEEVQRTFRALVDGKIEGLNIAINVQSTRAKRELPYAAIWSMSRIQFEQIADAMLVSSRFEGKTLGEIADICDDIGIENRFFRLNQGVADWIDNNEPVGNFDYMVM